jgi:hypothetical protein
MTTPNPLIAALFAGKNKTASEEEAQGEPIDLSKITAAEFVAGINDGSIIMPETEGDDDPEKTSSEEEIDLSKLTGRQLLELYAEAEEDKEKTAQEAELQKMAESGELQKWDMAGRVMAHAMNDELSKLAGAEEGLVSLDDISGEQLVEMLDSGEWELVDEEPASE